MAPVPLQGPRARALAAGAPPRSPPLPALGINPSFAQAGLGPKQWGFCPASPAITFSLLVAQPPLLAGWDSNSREDERGTWPDSPVPRPEPHIHPTKGKHQSWDSLCPLSDHPTPLPQSRDVLSWPAPGGGEETRTTGICDWVTPCQGALGRKSPCCRARHGDRGQPLSSGDTPGAGPSAPCRDLGGTSLVGI